MGVQGPELRSQDEGLGDRIGVRGEVGEVDEVGERRREGAVLRFRRAEADPCNVRPIHPARKGQFGSLTRAASDLQGASHPAPGTK